MRATTTSTNVDCENSIFSRMPPVPAAISAYERPPPPSGQKIVSHSAQHPFNAMMNYGDGVLVYRLRAEILAVGLDPTIGVVHANAANPIPLVYELIEPLSPLADKAVLQFALQPNSVRGISQSIHLAAED
jgi:hypothetical protein